jgi:hypothetical protein
MTNLGQELLAAFDISTCSELKIFGLTGVDRVEVVGYNAAVDAGLGAMVFRFGDRPGDIALCHCENRSGEPQ